jgi:chorismate lyase
MSPKFVPTELLLSKSRWLTSEDLSGHIISPSLKSALQSDGLLTSALEEVYGEPVSVKRLRQSEWADAHGVLGLRRDALLKAGNIQCVRASTLMPLSVIEAHPWLASLGDKPLGEALKNRGHYRQGLFEFTRIDAGLIFHPAPPAAQLLWARRSSFTFESGALLVTEIFLPGVLDRLNPAARLVRR